LIWPPISSLDGEGYARLSVTTTKSSPSWWLLNGPPAIMFNWQPSYTIQLSANNEAITNSNCFSNNGADIVLGVVSAVYNAITKTYPPEQAEVLTDLFQWQT